MARRIPQGLKPPDILALFGTTEVVPLHRAFANFAERKFFRSL